MNLNWSHLREGTANALKNTFGKKNFTFLVWYPRVGYFNLPMICLNPAQPTLRWKYIYSGVSCFFWDCRIATPGRCWIFKLLTLNRNLYKTRKAPLWEGLNFVVKNHNKLRQKQWSNNFLTTTSQHRLSLSAGSVKNYQIQVSPITCIQTCMNEYFRSQKHVASWPTPIRWNLLLQTTVNVTVKPNSVQNQK